MIQWFTNHSWAELCKHKQTWRWR